MRWVRDRTGRFRWRPFYHAGEIDAICEHLIRRFLCAWHGEVAYPVSTDDLTRLIEQEVDDLDLYADLSGLEDDRSTVEGVTTFIWGQRPRVRIARTLSLAPEHEVHLRATLAHELGHVVFHNFVGDPAPLPRVDGDADDASPRPPLPMTTVEMGRVDWMEWQADYACGAFLMPRTALQDTVRQWRAEDAVASRRLHDNDWPLIESVQERFLVSAAAARDRIHQVALLTENDVDDTMDVPRQI